MSRTEKLKGEAAHTCTILREAADRLAGWCRLLEADCSPSFLPVEEVRQTAQALAHQGGRLSMAVELTRKPEKGGAK